MHTGTRLVIVGIIGVWLLFGRKAKASTRDSVAVIEAETTASFYGPGFHGRQTASGEIFDQNALTAAMRLPMPFGTRVRVTDLNNGRSVVVTVNDRGPFTKRADGSFSRSIDLSVAAAAAIGLDIQKGLARVRLERV